MWWATNLLKGNIMEFKLGDVVQLKSGSPKMTIEDLYDNEGNKCSCKWFNKNKNEFQLDRFLVETLALASDSSK